MHVLGGNAEYGRNLRLLVHDVLALLQSVRRSPSHAATVAWFHRVVVLAGNAVGRVDLHKCLSLRDVGIAA